MHLIKKQSQLPQTAGKLALFFYIYICLDQQRLIEIQCREPPFQLGG